MGTRFFFATLDLLFVVYDLDTSFVCVSILLDYMTFKFVGEYEINQRCPGDVPNCVPCEERLPSCIGYSNGNHSFPTRNEYYVVCQDERTLSVQSCEPGIFDKALRRCSVSFDISESLTLN